MGVEIQKDDELQALRNSNRQLKELLMQSVAVNIEAEKLGRVFHDFNNILSSSMGYSSLAAERAGSLEDEKLTRYLENIEKAGVRARDLVRECLATRFAARNACQVKLQAVILRDFPSADVSELGDQYVYMSDQQLSVALRLVMSCCSSDGANMAFSYELIDEPNCTECMENIRGQQIRLTVNVSDDGFKQQDEADILLARHIFSCVGGHMCKSLVQENQFVVYLRAVAP